MSLFKIIPARRPPTLTPDLAAVTNCARAVGQIRDDFLPFVDERVLDVYARASDPDDPFELRDLWLARVEHELGPHACRLDLAERWRGSRVRRRVQPDDVLNSRATVRFVKELFNWFFRNDVYGDLRPQAQLILSGGAVDEEAWGLPETLKQCVRFALDRDWYGYSDSRGRVPTREAVARYENVRIEGAPYDVGNVALTLGGTFAISTLADFILLEAEATGVPALCGIPNYPPLVEAIARRRQTRLVPLPVRDGHASVDGLIAALTPHTPLVMLQTVANPTGVGVAEAELERLICATAPSTMILLDECHEWLGPSQRRSLLRAAPNVVRVSSLSKTWSAPGLKVGWILADCRFVEAYYEYASTSFGGPPSFFYTMVEVLARMERWVITGIDRPGPTELAEFEDSYGIDLVGLAAAYRAYRLDRLAREQELTMTRAAVVSRLAGVPTDVVRPRYSINVAVTFPGYDDSYLCFRDLLRRTGVSVYPGILNFCLSGGVVRITTARRWADLSRALARFQSLLSGQETDRG
ncbi:MAG: pyridoxal phosphate-dependent aminotransferase [Streptosporangiaceae bacterium]